MPLRINRERLGGEKFPEEWVKSLVYYVIHNIIDKSPLNSYIVLNVVSALPKPTCTVREVRQIMHHLCDFVKGIRRC